MLGCNSDKKKAYEFNQKLVAISEALRVKGTQIADALSIAANTKNFSRVDSANKDLLNYIDTKTAELKVMENVAGSEKLKLAMMDFMDFERDLVSSSFLPFGKMNESTPGEEIQFAVEQMMNKVKEEDKYLQRVQDAQKEYAAKNGFKVEAKKP